MDFEELRTMGWTENEVKVYISLLELGSAKVDSIAKRISKPRTTIYSILTTLTEKGVVSHAIKSGVKYFIASDPEKLISDQEEKISRLKKILPELNSIKQTVGKKPSVELYEGKKGIKTIYQDIIRTKKPLYSYGNTKLLVELLDFSIFNFIKKRIQEDIFLKLVTEVSESSIKMKDKDHRSLRETRFLDKLKGMPSAVYIYGNKVAMLTFIKSEPVGLIIANNEISRSQRLLFDILWEAAKDKQEQ